MVSQNKAKRQVTLTFSHDVDGPVFIAGSFNDWDASATEMKRGRDGKWTRRLTLPPGEYQFRYVADGKWFTDYAADGVVPNGMGEFNSLLVVPEKPAARPTSASASSLPRTAQNIARKQ